jgi:erythromycin esterase-like protein
MHLVLLAVACRGGDGGASGDSALPSDTAIEREPLAPGVWALDGLGEELPTHDLEPFFDAVGDARFVGLGESIHTSGGFEQAKLRLVRALVEQRGFRAVGFETPWADIAPAQEYVRTCAGSPADGLNSFLWVWQDVAVQALLEWMCAWNQEHEGDPVELWGWDTQQPWADGPRLEAYLAAAAPSLVGAASTCLGVDRADASEFNASPDVLELFYGVDPDDHEACIRGLGSVGAYFDDHEAELVAASSADELGWARVSLVSLEGWQWAAYYYSRDCAAGYEARDVANAYVLREIQRLSLPDARSVIWAHDTHLARDMTVVGGEYGDPTATGRCEGWEGMGTLLADALGDAYVAFAVGGYDVDIGWDSWDEPIVTPFDPRATEVVLHELGAPYAFADFAAESIFDTDRYELGGRWLVPRDQFRGMFFLDTSWAMDWALEDPFNEGCADGEVRIYGVAYSYDEDFAPDVAHGASVCAVDGACTSAATDGSYGLCVPAHENVALTYDLDGSCGQTDLVSTAEDSLYRDLVLFSDVTNAETYAAVGFAYPPAPGTGNASGAVYDANGHYLSGATITVSPQSGAGVVYVDGDLTPYALQSRTGGQSFFFLGELEAGWYDVTFGHPDVHRCRLTSGNYTSEGTTLHVPIVDGFETYLYVECQP